MSKVVMLIFPTRGVLVDATDQLRALDYITITNTALIAKAADGETVVSENDIDVVEGGITGGTLGSLMAAMGIAQLGAFLLPGVGPIIAIGAGVIAGGLIGGATGGLTAGLIDFGFKNDQLEALAERLQAGHIALVIEIKEDETVMPRLQTDLQAYQVDIVQP